MKPLKIVVGLSGGVDSSVAAYLLKAQGHEVIGLFMKNWHDDRVTIADECPWLEDSNDAIMVAQKLDIPFQTVDLSVAYKERIVDYMFNEYQRGRTPNPDVLCNREIKFDVFLKIALDLGADYVATGHYCRKRSFKKAGQIIYELLAGVDAHKDQSYFLCQLSQAQLAKALFPIGALTKSEVRKIAQAQGLITADKKDSQGLCFVGKVKLPTFLQQRLAPKKGDIVAIDATHAVYQQEISENVPNLERYRRWSQRIAYQPDWGTVVSTHEGAHFFTIGQRKGLAVGGTKEPLFVIGTDIATNTIYVGEGKNHPGLFSKALFVDESELHWLRGDLALNIGESLEVMTRFRYRQALQKVTLHRVEDGIFVVFDQPQSAITAGQFVAFYQGEGLIGSGVIF